MSNYQLTLSKVSSFLPGSGRQLTESRWNITSKTIKHSFTVAILNRTELSVNACAEKVDDVTTTQGPCETKNYITGVVWVNVGRLDLGWLLFWLHAQWLDQLRYRDSFPEANLQKRWPFKQWLDKKHFLAFVSNKITVCSTIKPYTVRYAICEAFIKTICQCVLFN